MLARVGARAARQALKTKTVVQQPVVALYSTSSKTWGPANDDKMQQVTLQTLITEVAEQQRQMASQVS
jgi:hypothetical protein